MQSHQLSPTKAAFKHHFKLANYQAYICKHALEPRNPNEGPEHHGWQLSNGELEIVWTDLLPAPKSVMELVCYICGGNCQTRSYSCVINELPYRVKRVHARISVRIIELHMKMRTMIKMKMMKKTSRN